MKERRNKKKKKNNPYFAKLGLSLYIPVIES